MKPTRKLAVDLSSILWNCLQAGKDPEGYKDVDEAGKEVHVNTAAYGYEHVINSIKAAMGRASVAPRDVILVQEGMNSKAPRLQIFNGYKLKAKRAPGAYKEFATLRDRIIQQFRNLGSLVLRQDNCEADDVMGWLADNVRCPLTIFTNDGDILVLNKVNQHGWEIRVDKNGEVGHNPYGVFPFRYVTLYKSMVGDTGDKISGIPGFGNAKWIDFHREFGEAGMAEMVRLAELGSLEELGIEATKNKMVARIYEGRAEFLRSYKLAKLHPEWVNGLTDPINWMPGLILPGERDERLTRWAPQMRLITKDNYNSALQFLRSKVAESPHFGVDLETSSPEESDEWLAERALTAGNSASIPQVDTMGAMITGGSISFGDNGQYSYYISVDHKDTNNVTLDDFGVMLQALPPEKLAIAHNAQGFELAVLYNHFGDKWKDNGWRGFLPNAVDTRIAAMYWNENLMKYNLKALTKHHFGYDQVTYEEITRNPDGGAPLKMNQLTGQHVLHYGADDAYTAQALWNFYEFFMQVEGTFVSFMEYEQKPMYVQALGYCKGIPLDLRRLSQLSKADDEAEAKAMRIIDSYLVTRGWPGTVCPQYAELDAKAVKEVCLLVLGEPLQTQVRTVLKMAPLIVEQFPEEPKARLIAELIVTGDVTSINALVQKHFTGKPILNVGSPNQMRDLIYDTIGIPVRLRNKPTPVMKAKGIREGQARTDEDCLKLAIKMGDVPPDVVPVVEALTEVKSIGTRRGLYWSKYPGMVHWKTGRLHPSLQQTWTNTKRYSGKDPNVQQMEGSAGGVRSVLLPHHRNAIVASLDESAQEVRQLADYCLDPDLLTCYLGRPDQLRDVHSIVGCKIAAITYDEFRKLYKQEDKDRREGPTGSMYTDIRQRAKITLFSTIYGATAPKIAETLGITEQEAQEYIDAIFAQFPGILKWKEDSENFCTQHGFVLVHGGNIRHLAEAIMSEDRYIASKALRQAGNARIQAAGGNQIKRIMSRIWDSRLYEDYDYMWYMSVHDETVHSMHKDHAKAVLKILHGFMTEQFLNVVPSASSIGIGKSYGTLIEMGEAYDESKIDAALAELFPAVQEAVAV